ncbi:hypothetical protein [Mucilaginibacter polytrichastri]|nr:hypothetical protein [Mucilaginibacter polytrichastri]
MFQSFTWQQFLVAALVFSLVWLLIVALVFYRKELFALLSGSSPDEAKRSVEPLKHAWQEDFEGSGDDDLMGRQALPDGVSIVSQDDFGFRRPVEVVAEGIDSPVADPDELLQSDVFDLMQNLKPLLSDHSLSKEDFIEQVNDEVSDFPRLLKSPLLVSVYEQIVDEVNEGVMAFKISLTELQEDL